MPRIHRSEGFSLAEVLIVVAIVAIVGAVAIPSYKNNLVKSNRSAAQQFMMSVSNREEQTFANLRSYVAVSANANFANAPTDTNSGLNLPVAPEIGANYTFVVTTLAGPPPSYQIKATPVTGSMQVGDHALFLDSAGNRWRDLNDNNAFDAATEDWSAQ